MLRCVFLSWEEKGAMRYEQIAPSCFRPNDVKIPCGHCLNDMRLMVLEPHPRSKLDVLTYRCDHATRRSPYRPNSSGEGRPDLLLHGDFSPAITFAPCTGTHGQVRRYGHRVVVLGEFSVLTRRYVTRQVAALLELAKSTQNATLSAVLVERAADLKLRSDEAPRDANNDLAAPDVLRGK
jgi:hypothetical protein